MTDDFDLSEELYSEIELNNDVIDTLEEDIDFDNDNDHTMERDNQTGGNNIQEISQVLSQKLSQLSTSHQVQQRNVRSSAKIPPYLCNRKGSFQMLINEILSTTMSTTTSASSIPLYNEEDLRQIAILIHKMKSEQTFQSLWMAYLKSGMDQLKMNQTGTVFWPIQVKTIMKQTLNVGINENDACMALIQDRLQGFSVRIQTYQTELDVLKNRPQSGIETVYQTIQTFIQQKLESLCQRIEHRIALIPYDYKDQALEFEFLQQNPSTHCIKLYKHLYSVKYKQDITRDEVSLVKQRISHYENSSQSKLQIAHPTFFHTIHDRDVPQQLSYQLTAALEEAKTDMLNLYVKTAETQMQHYDKQYNQELQKMFTERKEKSLPVDQQLTSPMLNLLEKRADNRHERMKCVNQHKMYCFRSKIDHT